MSHWTNSGMWEICLGGPNWKKSFWENKNGVDFEIEVRARLSGDLYGRVTVLDCLANFRNEKVIGTQHWNYIKRNVEMRFWRELSYIQKQILARHDPRQQPKVEHIHIAPTKVKEPYSNTSLDHQIIIPASAFHIPTMKNGNVILMQSSEQGEKLLHLRENGTVGSPLMIERSSSYLVYARVVTVHSNPAPINLIFADDISETNLEIKVPATGGYWATTDPIRVYLKEGLHQIRFCRNEGLGITMKEIVFSPAEQVH